MISPINLISIGAVKLFLVIVKPVGSKPACEVETRLVESKKPVGSKKAHEVATRLVETKNHRKFLNQSGCLRQMSASTQLV
jgi:hypothetical protein